MPRHGRLNKARAPAAACCAVAWALSGAWSPAVMIRHDVPDAAYTNLAHQSQFAASGVTLLTVGETTSATLVSPRHLVTAGHLVAGWVPAGTNEAPAAIGIRVGTNLYTGTHVFLFPGYDRARVAGGFDVALVRLSEPVTQACPAAVWIGGIGLGQRFTGVGQGRSGTGLDNNEPLPSGVFRAYENTADYLYGAGDYRHWRSDFDNGEPGYNTLAYVLYDTQNLSIAGSSLATPWPLEGTTAAGDSGSAAYVPTRTGWLLAGIASYRWYSQYGGQAGYVNLSAPDIAAWLAAVAAAEAAPVQFVREVPGLLVPQSAGAGLQLYGNLDRRYAIQAVDSLLPHQAWLTMTNVTATTMPLPIPLPPDAGAARFYRATELDLPPSAAP